MPSDSAQICNKALGRIGVTRFIESFEETSDEARVCGQFFAQAVEETLAGGVWPFARRRKVLALVGTAPTEWAYSYAVPDDCVTAEAISNGLRRNRADQRVPFVIESDADGRKLIYTDEASAVLIYTANVTNPGLFPPLFASAVSWLLAAELATAIKNDPREEDRCRSRWLQEINTAQAVALNEQQEDLPPESEFVSCR